MASTIPARPNTLPKNYPSVPAAYPDGLFRLQLDAARRYLYDSELQEVLEKAEIPVEVMSPTGESFQLSVSQLSVFCQELATITDEERAMAYGRDAFTRSTSIISRGNTVPPVLRAVSQADKMFLRIRDSMAVFNRKSGMNVLVKWHGGAECDIFDDTAHHCYGYVSDEPICYTMTGFLEEAVAYMSGVKVKLREIECMGRGAGACRWHAILI